MLSKGCGLDGSNIRETNEYYIVNRFDTGWSAWLNMTPGNGRKETPNGRTQGLSRPRLLRSNHPAGRLGAARRNHRPIRGQTRSLQRRADRPAPDLAVQRDLPDRRVPERRPWLMLNREDLDVLVHPLTESSYTTTARMRCGSARWCRCGPKFCGRPIAPSCCRAPRPSPA